MPVVNSAAVLLTAVLACTLPASVLGKIDADPNNLPEVCDWQTCHQQKGVLPEHGKHIIHKSLVEKPIFYKAFFRGPPGTKLVLFIDNEAKLSFLDSTNGASENGNVVVQLEECLVPGKYVWAAYGSKLSSAGNYTAWIYADHSYDCTGGPDDDPNETAAETGVSDNENARDWQNAADVGFSLVPAKPIDPSHAAGILQDLNNIAADKQPEGVPTGLKNDGAAGGSSLSFGMWDVDPDNSEDDKESDDNSGPDSPKGMPVVNEATPTEAPEAGETVAAGEGEGVEVAAGVPNGEGKGEENGEGKGDGEGPTSIKEMHDAPASPHDAPASPDAEHTSSGNGGVGEKAPVSHVDGSATVPDHNVAAVESSGSDSTPAAEKSKKVLYLTLVISVVTCLGIITGSVIVSLRRRNRRRRRQSRFSAHGRFSRPNGPNDDAILSSNPAWAAFESPKDKQKKMSFDFAETFTGEFNDAPHSPVITADGDNDDILSGSGKAPTTHRAPTISYPPSSASSNGNRNNVPVPFASTTLDTGDLTEFANQRTGSGYLSAADISANRRYSDGDEIYKASSSASGFPGVGGLSSQSVEFGGKKNRAARTSSIPQNLQERVYGGATNEAWHSIDLDTGMAGGDDDDGGDITGQIKRNAQTRRSLNLKGTVV